jgi:phenylalanyl-tRNA synthetase beta chain
VLIEAANFDPVSIARTARRHKLPSEASKRFERGVDPQIAAAPRRRVAPAHGRARRRHRRRRRLLIDEARGAAAILLPDGYVPRSSASSTPTDEVHDALAEIGGAITRTATDLGRAAVVAPDLTGKATSPRRSPASPATTASRRCCPSPARTRPHALAAHPAPGRRRARRGRVHRGALLPVRDRGRERAVRQRRRIVRGIRDARERARRLDGAHAALAAAGADRRAKRNRSRGLVDVSLFELGLVFLPETGAPTAAPSCRRRRASDRGGARSAAGGHPAAAPHVGALLVGDVVTKQPGQAAVPPASSTRSTSCARSRSRSAPRSSGAGLAPGAATRVAPPSCAWPDGRSGSRASCCRRVAEENDLPRVVAVVELDLDAVIGLTEPGLEAGQIGTYPAATQDLSLLVDADVPASAVAGAGPRGRRAPCSRSSTSSTTTAAPGCPTARRA